MIAPNFRPGLTDAAGPQTDGKGHEAEPAPASSPILTRLLRMAESYLAARSLHQAMALFFRLVDQFPDSPEAARARELLLEIGDRHERLGEMHQARSIYERLL